MKKQTLKRLSIPAGFILSGAIIDIFALSCQLMLNNSNNLVNCVRRLERQEVPRLEQSATRDPSFQSRNLYSSLEELKSSQEYKQDLNHYAEKTRENRGLGLFGLGLIALGLGTKAVSLVGGLYCNNSREYI